MKTSLVTVDACIQLHDHVSVTCTVVDFILFFSYDVIVVITEAVAWVEECMEG